MVETKERLDHIWEVHRYRSDVLLARQAAERVDEGEVQKLVIENLALFKFALEQLRPARG